MKKTILMSLIALMAFAPIYAFAAGCCGSSPEKTKCTCPAGTDCAGIGCKCGCQGGCCGK